jgi:uncharacterized protein (DUF3820 family)
MINEVRESRLWTLKGKYIGVEVERIPESYLLWCKNNFQEKSYGHKLACAELEMRDNIRMIESVINR